MDITGMDDKQLEKTANAEILKNGIMIDEIVDKITEIGTNNYGLDDSQIIAKLRIDRINNPENYIWKERMNLDLRGNILTNALISNKVVVKSLCKHILSHLNNKNLSATGLDKTAEKEFAEGLLSYIKIDPSKVLNMLRKSAPVLDLATDNISDVVIKLPSKKTGKPEPMPDDNFIGVYQRGGTGFEDVGYQWRDNNGNKGFTLFDVKTNKEGRGANLIQERPLFRNITKDLFYVYLKYDIGNGNKAIFTKCFITHIRKLNVNGLGFQGGKDYQAEMKNFMTQADVDELVPPTFNNQLKQQTKEFLLNLLNTNKAQLTGEDIFNVRGVNAGNVRTNLSKTKMIEIIIRKSLITQDELTNLIPTNNHIAKDNIATVDSFRLDLVERLRGDIKDNIREAISRYYKNIL